MGTWIKETDKAIYLMQGGYWISRLTKYPSKTNPQEKVLNVKAMTSWFTRSDPPTAMIVSSGAGAEPSPLPASSKAAAPQSPAGIPGKMNAAGLKLLTAFEGLELEAYQDSVGVWTIGYGHTSAAGPPKVTTGLRITEADANTILKRDLGQFEQGIRERVSVALNSNQFSALVSFSFNVGLGAFGNSTLRRKLNGGDYGGAANELLRWDKAGGRALPGLTRRRQAERALFLSEDYTQFL
ncbi:MAG: lysozyme [Leptolyngbyaceae cyanobacterium]